MDDQTIAAMQKWPNVPYCFGWLMLDRRGCWRILNPESTQFHGQIIHHAGMVGFINRHYQVDDFGRYFFQNGPQRVYVDLDYCPWVVFRQIGENVLLTQTGALWRVDACLMDEQGNVLFTSQDVHRGYQQIANLNDHDLLWFSEYYNEQNNTFNGLGVSMTVQMVDSSVLPLQFGFDKMPKPRPDERDDANRFNVH